MWHGIPSGNVPTKLLPASEFGGWWKIIDHDFFLDPPDDEDIASEVNAELRTAYGNIIYDAFLKSGQSELAEMASTSGLHGLGGKISMIFVSLDRNYVERFYGPAVAINQNADGLLAVIPDDNIHPDRASWIMVFEARSPFPLKPKPPSRIQHPAFR